MTKPAGPATAPSQERDFPDAIRTCKLALGDEPRRQQMVTTEPGQQRPRGLRGVGRLIGQGQRRQIVEGKGHNGPETQGRLRIARFEHVRLGHHVDGAALHPRAISVLDGFDAGPRRFLTRRSDLEKLPGLSHREQAMRGAGGPAPGDLTEVLEFAA